MPTQEQIAYVRQQLDNGLSREQVASTLRNNGYADDLITQIFRAIEHPDSVPNHTQTHEQSTGDQMGQTAQPEGDTVQRPNLGSNDDNAKVLSAVGYVVPFVFLYTLLSEAHKHHQFARFHANQQLNVHFVWAVFFIASTALNIFGAGMLYGVIMFVDSLLWLVYLVAFITFAVIGIKNVLNDRMKPLPVIGTFNFLK